MKKYMFTVGALIIAIVSLHFLRPHVSYQSPTEVMEENGTYTAVFLSSPFEIDALYGSMEGPIQLDPIQISKEHEKIWITKMQLTAVDEEGSPLPQEDSICHSQLRYISDDAFHVQNKKLFGATRNLPPKWGSFVQGAFTIDLPEGFGIPAYSDEGLRTMHMAFNMDPEREPYTMRVKTEIAYQKEADVADKIMPLGRTAFAVRTLLDPEVAKEMHGHAAHEGDCSLSESDTIIHTGHHQPRACTAHRGMMDLIEGSMLLHAEPAHAESTIEEIDGEQMVAHWMVPPGTHTFSTGFIGSDVFPFDTTLHQIAAHLHVYGSHITLYDKTEEKILFRSFAEPNAKHEYMQNMTVYRDTKGIPVHTDHEYELIAVYENTTPEAIDAMGVMYFYFKDKEI